MTVKPKNLAVPCLKREKGHCKECNTYHSWMRKQLDAGWSLGDEDSFLYMHIKVPKVDD